MKIDLKPYSCEWFKYHEKYINDHEISIIMGFHPRFRKEELIKKKISENYFYIEEELDVEKKTKLHANLFFSIFKKKNYEPAVFIKNNFISHLDGYHSESETMLEIKCPLKTEDIIFWKKLKKTKKIPPYYFSKIQCKIYCSESLKSYFLVYFDEKDYFFQEIQLDNSFIKKMIIETNSYNKTLEKYKKIIKS
ncbi:lambda-exonuclease family protein [Candidatus Phytoplasma sacchari]|uniref:Endonuclease n=1 Tax=Candidatus Phytoplasma sacchari TaxID=2609813 RepID=A0ABY7M0G7_9MOLU|nr:endonuclease [Candidatus Phytoplasma sacchari]KAB8122187.1 endonuclease [Candidatus Phytoplasma sacchari]WBL31218.1 endonuclease [Candidatus Phytoplasma sacchari]